MIILINNHKLSHAKWLKDRLVEGLPRWQVQVIYQRRWRNCPHPFGSVDVRCQNEKERIRADQFPATTTYGRGNFPKTGHVINFPGPDNNGLLLTIRRITRTPGHVVPHASFRQRSVKTGDQRGQESCSRCRTRDNRFTWSHMISCLKETFNIRLVPEALFRLG